MTSRASTRKSVVRSELGSGRILASSGGYASPALEHHRRWCSAMLGPWTGTANIIVFPSFPEEQRRALRGSMHAHCGRDASWDNGTLLVPHLTTASAMVHRLAATAASAMAVGSIACVTGSRHQRHCRRQARTDFHPSAVPAERAPATCPLDISCLRTTRSGAKTWGRMLDQRPSLSGSRDWARIASLLRRRLAGQLNRRAAIRVRPLGGQRCLGWAAG